MDKITLEEATNIELSKLKNDKKNLEEEVVRLREIIKKSVINGASYQTQSDITQRM